MQRARRLFSQTSGIRLARFFRWTALLIAFMFLVGPARAIEPVFRDEMDGTQTMLKLHNERNFKVLEQSIDHKRGGEIIRLQGPAGESAELVFSIPNAPVINELWMSAMIHCDRQGVQIAARAVLPRSQDPLTGRPYELLLKGGNISRGLASEKLVLKDLPKLLERHARVARLQTPESVDTREAYVSQIVFLVPGGPGTTTLAVDRVEFYGVLKNGIVDPEVQQATAETEQLFEGPVLPGIPNESSPAVPVPQAAATGSPPPIDASAIHRIIRWQGEPFEFLARLGFNTVWLARQPTDQELAEAVKAGVSLISPPPSLEQLDREGIPAKWNSVLAWDLGSMLAREDLEHVARLQRQIQHYDSVESRSTVMTCEQLSRDVSRTADALLLGREILGTDLTLRDYVTWLGQRQRIARPGTPLWVTIETELSSARAQQVTALCGIADPLPLNASHEQLTALTAAAMSVKSRNFVFSSESSLMEKTPAAEQRARNLELINLRLQLLSPWLATGKVSGVAQSSEPGLSAMVFQAERSHLLMPVAWSRNFQSQQSLYMNRPVSFLVPGVAESTDVYLLTLAGAKRLRHERTTGGLRVSAESLPVDGLIMLTSDSQAFSRVSQYLRQVSGRAARLHRDVVAHQLQQLEQLIANSPERTESIDAFRTLIGRSIQELAACDRNLASGYHELAYDRADTIEQVLAQAEYVLRNRPGEPITLVTPLGFSTATLFEERKLANLLSTAMASGELLAGGNFEDLNGLLQSGWRHQQLPHAGITSAVRLSPDMPHEGAYCLELEARNLDVNAPTSVVPTAPVWISTQGIAVKTGDLVEISGVARVPEQLIGTVDGLQIIDSLGGPGMATRIIHSPSWRSFRIVRGVTTDTQLVVSIALSGLGKAQVDDLRVRKLTPAGTVAIQPSAIPRQ